MAQNRAASEVRRGHPCSHANDTEDEGMWDAPLQRLRVVHVADADTLLWELATLEHQLDTASKPASPDTHLKRLKLIVVDSIGTAFAPIIGGTSHIAYSLLVSVVQTLQRIAARFHVCVLVTNHTTSG